MHTHDCKHEVQFSGFGEFAIYHFDHWLSKGEIVLEPNFVGGHPAYFKVTKVRKNEERNVMLCKFKKIFAFWVKITNQKVTIVK